MKTSTRKKIAANKSRQSDPAVDAVFETYPRPVKAKLLALRRLILDTAKATQSVGALRVKKEWIASSLGSLAQTLCVCCTQ